MPDGAGVGPYWFVKTDRGSVELLYHRCLLNEAEAYGDFLTCPHGHYDIWETWRAEQFPTTVAELVARIYEYEEWPRGRVVFKRSTRQFIVYADEQVLRLQLGSIVLKRFAIPADQAVFLDDEHYRSLRTLDVGRVDCR